MEELLVKIGELIAKFFASSIPEKILVALDDLYNSGLSIIRQFLEILAK